MAINYRFLGSSTYSTLPRRRLYRNFTFGLSGSVVHQTPIQPSGADSSSGICKVCEQYTLWGDVVRGCYRRARGGLQQPDLGQDPEDNDQEASAQAVDDLSRHTNALQISGSPRKVRTVKSTAPKSCAKSTSRANRRNVQKDGVIPTSRILGPKWMQWIATQRIRNPLTHHEGKMHRLRVISVPLNHKGQKDSGVLRQGTGY
ncbi:hypothetical protein RHS01_07907 [Rhizoctonia solani]|uniref:Uncharacterized protein n=1 Tax=Rhizoctonia solani TaxID=456999 RepID=A0A8H7I9G3_9AGAM|nr:hypothetical protein RHS01_07907 [Rhizoctonia solani]